MQASKFNVRVPLAAHDAVFLMNTLTDAQLVVPTEVTSLLDRFVGSEGDPSSASTWTEDEREALNLLSEHGFLVEDHARERETLERFFDDVREDTREMRVTILTTLQCNFACDYCFQGDHAGLDKNLDKMSLDTARQVVEWVTGRLDEIRPDRFAITFFGGEPLLNLPVMYALADELWAACQARQVRMHVDVITNGLLLTPEIVARLKPYGLSGIKVTLDGDQATHDRMRPLRGGQPTFDRIIENIRRVADDCPITIGGNFDESSVDSYPALLDFLGAQAFADRLAKVSFKPIIKTTPSPASGIIPLTVVGDGGAALGGTCMSSAGSGSRPASSPCDMCHFVEEKTAFLRNETERRGFPTVDGVHMGPCEIHRRHAYTLGPDGSLYACPGFTGEQHLSTGHIDGRTDGRRDDALARFDRLAPWKACGDCSFIPVCGGGCSVASHAEQGDMMAPSCHKPSFETALTGLAMKAVTPTQETCA